MITKEHIGNGRKWIERHILNQELYHYGVKGMKWGVRKDDEKVTKKHPLIEEELRSGRISTTINKDKQRQHTKNGHVSGRSYLNGDDKYAQKLVNDLSGTGEPVMSRKGEWTHREKVESRNTIGTHVDRNGVKTATNKAMIVYSKTGSHIYPR